MLSDGEQQSEISAHSSVVLLTSFVGVLPVAEEEEETDDVNSFDSETASEGPGKASAGVQLPAANRPGACALSIPGERGNGVLPVAEEEEETDDVNSFDSETASEGPGKASAGVQLPAANRPGACALSIPGERGNGVLPVAEEEEETDDVNSFDVETASEGPGKASAGVQLPAANRPGACALSIPGERGNGVLPVAEEEEETDDVNSFDSETASEGPGKASAGVQLPAANRPGACALSIPGERGNGVLPVAEEEEETDDVNSFDVETVSEGPGKASAGVQLPAANRPGACALSIPGERGNGNLLTD
ncbi:spidroin-2-like [Phalacrocorax carbo]|uniref:spidroin-2-like n=1 Tax=Phalacrocorax carbo TaxID=9209 RepID=UPI0031196743